MSKIKSFEVLAFLSDQLSELNPRRLRLLESITLKHLLTGINPYWFRIEKMDSARDLIVRWLDQQLFLRDIIWLDELMMSLATFVCNRVHNGHISSLGGVDLEFDQGNTHYLVSVQASSMAANEPYQQERAALLRKAQFELAADMRGKRVIAVNGFCYGMSHQAPASDYLELRGQNFWSFISDRDNFFVEIIEPIASVYKTIPLTFQDRYVAIVVRLWQEFIDNFITDYAIDYEKLIRYTCKKA